VEDIAGPDPDKYRKALRLLRRRRKYLFGTILVYIPALLVTQRVSPTDRSMGIVFGVWFAALFYFALLSAVTRCPRCGNYFHVNGMMMLYLRRCLHCQHHINADRNQTRQSQGRCIQ